jgi:hypothetical protein
MNEITRAIQLNSGLSRNVAMSMLVLNKRDSQ